MSLYLLHFEPRYRHAGHYLGYTEDPDPAARLDRHIQGRGSPLIRAALASGSRIHLVRLWQDDIYEVELAGVQISVVKAANRTLERRLKNQGSSARHCPVCRRRRPLSDSPAVSASDPRTAWVRAHLSGLTAQLVW